VLLAAATACHAESASQAVRAGNKLFARKDWQGAIAAYDRAAAIDPASQVPKFNKAGALFKSGDYKGAVDGFNAVAGESRDLAMVAKAKYNLGNCAFKEGMRQKDSDMEKSIKSIRDAIGKWREVLAIQPGNKRARENIDKAALFLKKLMDEQKKKKQEQNKDPNSQQQKQGQGEQKKQEQQQDPNKPGQQGQDKKDQQEQKKEEQKKEEQKKEGGQQQKMEQKQAPDTDAQQILNDEQDRKKELRPNQPGGYQPVDQDW
jgi:Ca-activated chloride channel homolog